MVDYFLAFLAVFGVSLVSLIGVITLSFKRELINRASTLMVGFAAGTLFGDVFIHLLPESFAVIKEDTYISLLIIGGVLLFFILEKILRWRHCHEIDCAEHQPHLVRMNLIGDVVHNFIDGLVIGGSFFVSREIGIATTLAVFFHEIPQEIGDFGVLIHSGLSVNRALLFNFLSALAALIGFGLVAAIGPRFESLVDYLLPFTAGGFLYIAGSDLIPELHHEVRPSKSFLQLLFLVLGITVMLALRTLD